jgi:hypothetical protein
MSEEQAERGSNSSSSRPNSSRSGGRGRGRGRGGRGKGRGRGRGRGKGRSSSDSTEAPVTATQSNEATTEPSKNSNDQGDVSKSRESPGRGRGRGGRSSGRGRSRGGRVGRGRGRGRQNKMKNSRSNSPSADEGTDQNGQEHDDLADSAILETGFKEKTEPTFEIPNQNNQAAEETEQLRSNENTMAPPTLLTTSQLNLPTPPPSFTGREGVPMILSRNSHPPMQSTVDYDSEAQKLSECLATAALEDSDDFSDEKKEVSTSDEKKEVSASEEATPIFEKPPGADAKPPGNPKKKNKKKNKKAPAPVVEEEPTEEVTTTEAFKAVPAQEVSITSNTTVQIRRSESAVSIDKSEEETPKVTGAGDTSKKGKSRKKKALSKDDAVNQRAAKAFNKAVRQCVERSDPESMRDILHDRQNHNFALDQNVLETVMKAYVMAAMFEDALYCLRNCTLPGTLSAGQMERILICLPQNLRNSSAYTAADMINALCIATEFDNPTSRTYFLRIARGISLEFLEDVMSARDRICSAPCERLVRSAVCVVDARLKRGKKPTDLVVVPGDQLGVFVSDSMENRGIQAGDAVSLLPYAGPYPMSAESLDRNMIEATVTNTNPMVLRLQDKTNANLLAMLIEPVEGNVYRVDKLANRMGFNRQLTAAVAIASPFGDSKTRDTRRPCPQLMKAITAMDENIDLVMNQSGGMFKDEVTSTAAFCAQAVPWHFEDEKEDGNNDDDAFRMASRLTLDKYGALDGLNVSQQMAVEGAVSNRLTLVQGPPGTGKDLPF